jgi:hypothetical protein
MIKSPGLRPGAFCCEPSPHLLAAANRRYDRSSGRQVMGLLYELIVDTEAGTTTVQIEANSKEEALENGQELYPGCRLALVNPEP